MLAHIKTPNIARLMLLLVTMIPIAEADPSKKPAVPGIIGTDDRIIRDSWDYPWSAIGRLNMTTGGFCTATVIAPRRIITAAHCLWNRRTGRWYPPCALHFLAGYRRSSFKVHALISDIQIAPGYRGDSPRAGLDWAILTLDQDVSTSTGTIPLAERKPAKGTRLLQAGYSRDRKHLLTIDPSCRVTSIKSSSLLLTHDCDATFGDSGSPLLVRDRTGGFRVTAIHTAFGRKKGQTVGIGVSADEARKWATGNPVRQPPGEMKACAVEPAMPSRQIAWSAL